MTLDLYLSANALVFLFKGGYNVIPVEAQKTFSSLPRIICVNEQAMRQNRSTNHGPGSSKGQLCLNFIPSSHKASNVSLILCHYTYRIFSLKNVAVK